MAILVSLVVGFTLGIIFKSKLVAAEKQAAEALRAKGLEIFSKK